MRNSIVFALARCRSQVDLLPVSGLQQPLVRGTRDIAAVEEVRPDDVDALCDKILARTFLLETE